MRKRRSPKHPGVVLLKPSSKKRMGWRARYTDPDSERTVYVTLDPSLSTLEQREQWAVWKSRELTKRRMALDGGAPRATGTALKDAVERYFRAHPHLSARSKLDYGSAAQKLLAWASKAGIRSADDLTRARLMAFREQLISEPKRAYVKGRGRGARVLSAELRAPHSINGELRKVRTVLGYLRKIDLLPRLTNDDLRDGLQRLPIKTERIEFLKPRDCQRLLEAALRHDAERFAETREEHGGEGRRRIGTTARYKPIAPFAAFVLLTGMRLNEAIELEWNQVDLEALDDDGQQAGEIHLAGGDTKTKHARTVVLEVSSYLRKMLAAMHLVTGGKGSVFGLSEGVAESSAKRLRTTYGAPSNVTWQMLRCTCGTYLTNAPGIFGAASAYRSAKQLGHSVQVAEKYYVGLIRGIPRDARSLEAAMQIEDAMKRVASACANPGSTVSPLGAVGVPMR